jgi:hypothetical protein
VLCWVGGGITRGGVGAQGALSRFVCVYFGYITQGCAGGALAGCYEPTCQMLSFPYTIPALLQIRLLRKHGGTHASMKQVFAGAHNGMDYQRWR